MTLWSDLSTLFSRVISVFSTYDWLSDTLDILLLTVVLYAVYLFMKGRRAWKLIVGLVLILVMYTVSDIANLHATHELLSAIAPYGVILLAVVFQPEIRDVLERLGSKPFGVFSAGKDKSADLAHTVSEVVDAACQIAMAEKDGALIVIERSTPLGDYADKGHLLDAAVTGDLLRNIFVDRSPLHDGAVIIRANRIAAAGSKLPLTANEEVARGMGTRHRAAVGITEVSDCVVVVVSEEKHIISIANNGFIKRDYNKSAADFQNEATMKAVQNALRKDLFRLLAGTAYDEEDRADERRRVKVHFKLSLKDTVKDGPAQKLPRSTRFARKDQTLDAEPTSAEGAADTLLSEQRDGDASRE